MITIYALTDPRNGKVVYVGRTSNLVHRMSKHYSPQTGVGTLKTELVRELKKEGLRVGHFVLDVVSKEVAPFWERYYTDLYRSWGFKLLNNTHYKFGNQTSFQPGEAVKAVVALNRDGSVHSEYPSLKEAAAAVGVRSIAQSLAKRKKRIGGFIWFYKEQYNLMSQEEIDKVLTWANTSGLVANSGSFKKIVVSDEITEQIINYYKEYNPPIKNIADKFGISQWVISRIIAPFKTK